VIVGYGGWRPGVGEESNLSLLKICHMGLHLARLGMAYVAGEGAAMQAIL